MEIGLLLLRTIVWAVLFTHATQKAFGWFSGQGFAGASSTFEKLGQAPANVMVVVAVVCELLSSTMLLLGLLTPLGTAMAAGTLLVAGTSTAMATGSLWHVRGGGEYPLVMALVCIGIGFTGPGQLSLDAVLEFPWYDGDTMTAVTWGLCAFGAAFAGSVVPVLRSRSVLRAQMASAPQ